MKKIKFLSIAAIAGAALLFIANSCTKKSTDTPASTCKTCKALGVDGTIQQQVCTPAEEAAFRAAHAGREVSCQ